MLFALLGLHAVLGMAAPLAARRLGRRVLLLCAVAPAATVVYALALAPDLVAGRSHVEPLAWVSALRLDVSLRLDAFALLMVALVSGVGVLIFVYAYAYFAHSTANMGRFAAALTAFAGAMLGLVLADNLLALYVFWEATSVTSYLLIGFEDRKGSARAAARHALIVTAAGGLAMLAGFVVLGEAAGTYSLAELVAAPPSGGPVTAGVLLVLAGAFTKSAQVPFHNWLPAAMAAPTPVSAYLHSATMVKAGVYLVARLAPALAAVAVWRPLVVGVGVATMLVGGWRALRQHDLKLLLAFGTVSQLGFLVALLGAGVPQATLAGVLLLLAHGAFKAALFMVAGIVDHQAGTRDIRLLSGLGRRLPLLAGVAVAAAASMAGIPPLLGFIAKEAAFEAYLHGELGGLGTVALVGVVTGSVLTVAYSARFLLGTFGTRRSPVGQHAGDAARPPERSFLAPALLLAALGLVAGLVPALVGPLAVPAAQALDGAVEGEPLKLWHGFNVALGLSALVLALGAVGALARERLEAWQARVGGLPGGEEAYEAFLRALNSGADRLTGIVQNGSLPIYLGVILLTALVLPGAALLPVLVASPPAPQSFAESPLQAVVCAGVALISLAILVVRRRFTAVLCLGGVGYAVAILFVLQGAPDLALTQLLVETLAVVIFVLVLRHLPDRFEPHRWPLGQALRKVIAVSVALWVFGFALLTASARTAEPVSGEFLARALPEGGGRNVVNVILVDFRGFDTFGEITVLVVAGLGIAMLLRAVRADRRAPEAVAQEAAPATGPAAARRAAPAATRER